MPGRTGTARRNGYSSDKANDPKFNKSGACQAFRLLQMGRRPQQSFPFLVTIGGFGFGKPVIDLLKEEDIIGPDLSLTPRGRIALEINENPFQ